MKRFLSVFLLVALLFSCMVVGIPTVNAAEKVETPRAIAIVFDNSGSMYDAGDQAWCRATYAMEVFAAMLNKGDVLQIYPMHPIAVGNNEYTMQSPFQITDASQAASIREILTKNAGGTPIESIDCAVNGLKSIQMQKKYLIVLTDGGTFSKNGYGLSKDRTTTELDNRIQANANKDMTVMYLGIGSDACIPNTAQSEYFIKKQAVNTADVLATLTEMCNLIFGRDTLPKSNVTSKSLNFDISMSKLIVFVQGTDITGLKLTSASGGSVGTLVSTMQTKYSTKGAADYKSVADTSLQGMIVTYENCDAGTYNIEYSGAANSVEVYYEPDADLDFVFTDSEGNNVDINGLYEGEYKVRFGMKDAKTKKLISSSLLGNPQYQGNCIVNGQKKPITYKGYSGEIPVTLKANDTFEAELTVTYLSGYTISKNSSEFGFPKGGIVILATPLGKFEMDLQVPQSDIVIGEVGQSQAIRVDFKFDGKKLTPEEFKAITLQVDTSGIEHTITPLEQESAYTIQLAETAGIGEGQYDITVKADYLDAQKREASCTKTSSVTLSYPPAGNLQMDLEMPTDFLVIGELAESEEMTVNLTLDGRKLTPEEFKSVVFQADCGGIKHTVIPDENNSLYKIKLESTEGIEDGRYKINADAKYLDEHGRETTDNTSSNVTLSYMQLWQKWLLNLLPFVIFFIIIWWITHIRVLPKKMHTTRNLSSMYYDGDNVTNHTNFLAEIKQNSAKIQVKYGGKQFGLIMDVVPGKDSYLYKPHKDKSAEVKVDSVRKFGQAKILEATICNVKYILDDKGKFVPATKRKTPIIMRNGNRVRFSGTIKDAGVDKTFESNSILKFN